MRSTQPSQAETTARLAKSWAIIDRLDLARQKLDLTWTDVHQRCLADPDHSLIRAAAAEAGRRPPSDRTCELVLTGIAERAHWDTHDPFEGLA